MNINNLYIIADFDHTITDKNSNSSWGVLETSSILPEKYQKECARLKDYYMPIEKNTNIPKEEKTKFMKEWLEKNLNIFIKCKLSEEKINKVSTKKDCMILRKGAKDFLKYTNEHHIPIIIISAGISNIIENFLKSNNLMYDNIYIISNIIKYKDGVIKGFRNEEIHSLNKNSIIMPVKIKEVIDKREKILLLGDNIEDTLMIPRDKKENAFKIGFVNGHKENTKKYKETFDVIYDDESLNEVIELIKNTHD